MRVLGLKLGVKPAFFAGQAQVTLQKMHAMVALLQIISSRKDRVN
jgi:hypothetical protein